MGAITLPGAVGHIHAMRWFFLLAVVIGGGFFIRELYRAWVDGEILGRGWWGRTAIYSRQEQPLLFWLTALTYGAWILFMAYLLWRMLGKFN